MFVTAVFCGRLAQRTLRSIILLSILLVSLDRGGMAQVGTVLGVPNTFTTSCAHTFYISQSAGNDSNNGTAKTTPWKHHPYMSTFTGSYAHTASDCFIFKGGDTWGSSDLGTGLKTMGYGSSTTAYDYYGVDTTWYTGASWVRPIFNAQASTSILEIFWVYASDGTDGSFVTIDSLELTGEYINGTGAYESVYIGQNHDVLMNNLNIHGWTGNLANMGNTVGNYWGGVGDNNPTNLTNVTLQNSYIHNETGCMTASITQVSRSSNVATVTVSSTIPANWIASGNTKIWITGATDSSFNVDNGGITTTSTTSTSFTFPNTGSNVSTESSAGTVYSECGVAVEYAQTLANNEFYSVGTVLIHGGKFVHDNYVHDNPGIYCDCGSTNNFGIDTWEGTPAVSFNTTSYTYRNRIVNSNLGTSWFPGPGVTVAAGFTATAVLFDNVFIWRNGHTSNFAINVDPAYSGAPSTIGCGVANTCNIQIWNNTLVLDPSDNAGCGQLTNRGSQYFNNVSIQNNHCIGPSGGWLDFSSYVPTYIKGTFTQGNQANMLNATASTSGYSFISTGSTLNYAPTNQTCNGNSNASTCTVANGIGLASLCTGTPLNPYLCQDINGISRLTSNWDIGAYQSSTGNSGPASISALVRD